MSVLYEDLRIETSAISASSDELATLDDLDARYRIHYFLRRSVATLYEFRRALNTVIKDKEYTRARTSDVRQVLFEKVDLAQSFFDKNFAVIRDLRNNVGGHFDEKAADFATAHVATDAVEKLEIAFHPYKSGGGAKLHYAGEIAAVALRSFQQNKPRDEELDDIIGMITDAHAHAVLAMYALVILFLWDRFT
jgi:hypothetical protein